MIYGGEPLHGNNPSDWETVSILRSDLLGLYGDGLESVYDKNLKACQYAEDQARELYDVLYHKDDAANLAQRRLEGENAYGKMIRIKRNLDNTRFERASRSRYNFGSLCRGNDGLVYMKLNLQIRFKK